MVELGRPGRQKIGALVQLTNPGSTRYPCSLLLQYPVEFLAWIPFRAAKRTQWAVVSASLAVVLVFWAVTPLQSGIFNIAPATISRDVFVSPPARLLPPSLQTGVLGGNLPNAAYGVTWLGQKLPPFTSRDFALAPFSWPDLKITGSNASGVANTTLYRSELNCFAPASIISRPEMLRGFLEVGDGSGCTEITNITDTSGAQGNNGFQKLVCNKYFTVWQRQGNDIANLSTLIARFCQPTYYSQPVKAKISVPDGRVLDTWSLGPQSSLPLDDFNSTLLEFIVTYGRTPGNLQYVRSLHQREPRPFDISEDTILVQHFRAMQRDFPPLNSIMAGIAVGGQNLTFDRFVNDTAAIDAALRDAQRLFFALAIGIVTEPNNVLEASHPAIHTFSLQSIQMVRGITYSVQAFLGLIALLVSVLAGIFYNKFLPFGSDPSSIAFLAALASRHQFLEYFKPLDREGDLATHIGNRQATLLSQNGAISLTLNPVDEELSIDEATEGSGLIADANPAEKGLALHNLWPTELKLPAGLSFTLGLCLGAATLIFLHEWMRIHQGLPLPSRNVVTQQIILNYLPTVFGTFVEPFLVVVCRCLCFLQPFEDLRRGSAKTSRTLLQTYTSLPPQLAIIAAIRNGHFRLASLSFAAILANVLTFALSGIFVIRETSISADMDALQVYSPTVNRSILDTSRSFQTVGASLPRTNGEPFQFLLSNIKTGTPLPPWTTNERYYLPINLTFAQNDSSTYHATTLGFEGFADCNVFTESPSALTYELSLNSDATQIRFLTTQSLPNGTKGECFAPMSMADQTVTFADLNHPPTQILVGGSPAGVKAIETFMVPIPGFGSHYQNRFICQDQVLGMWLRTNISLGDELSINNGPALTENIGMITGPTANTTSVFLENLVVGCKTRTYAASYNLTVDSTGQVLSGVELPNSSFIMNETILDGVFDQVRGSLAYPADFLFWHSDTRARDWMSFFIAKIAGSDSLLDPTVPLPDGDELGKRISDVLRRLFALTLAVNKESFLELPEAVTVTVQKVTTVNRVLLSDVMYKIALVILFLDVVIILNVYSSMSKPFLPRMPTSIASNVAYFAASHFAQELAEQADSRATPEDLVRHLKESDRRFGFGKFIGTSGGLHIGIEREPFVQLLQPRGGLRRRSKWRFWQS